MRTVPAQRACGQERGLPTTEVAAPPAPLPVTPDAPYGALDVRVRWHDGSPAADIGIVFLAADEPQLDRNRARVVSDSAGRAGIDRLHAGEVTLRSDRGGNLETEVIAGTRREVEPARPRP